MATDPKRGDLLVDPLTTRGSLGTTTVEARGSRREEGCEDGPPEPREGYPSSEGPEKDGDGWRSTFGLGDSPRGWILGV